MQKYLGVKPGSVSFFGLINDSEKSVILYIEKELLNVQKISFHPNDNRATLVISGKDFRFLLDQMEYVEHL
jgi:Ala-tRNA(Pro) deacylase